MGRLQLSPEGNPQNTWESGCLAFLLWAFKKWMVDHRTSLLGRMQCGEKWTLSPVHKTGTGKTNVFPRAKFFFARPATKKNYLSSRGASPVLSRL